MGWVLDVSSHTEVAGMRSISVEDPVIKEAAENALKGLNDSSNSLVPYELRQVLSAHAEASDEETNINLLLKVARGAKEEDVKADLHRTPRNGLLNKQVRSNYSDEETSVFAEGCC
ncbi:hypothetical protein R1flu_001608 [Riccia fluitans]|uniref:Uncharacterized protein n=1 Tax=Riccia fluitans TaxID=41844 RepID=A0ABD1Y3R6_9MARC